MEVMTGQLDAIGDVFEYIRTKMQIDTAEGVWLDRIFGRIVGLERPPRWQAYGTMFAFKEAEGDIDDPYKGFESGGIGGYWQTLEGVQYIADNSQKMSDDDYRDRILGQGIANYSDALITDIWKYITTGFNQNDPTIDSEAGKVTITVESGDVLSQGDRNLIIEKGPFAAGVEVAVLGWPVEYVPFTEDLDTASDWLISGDTINGKSSKTLQSIGAGDAYLDAINYYNESASSVAYGTWDFWLYHNTTSAISFFIISDAKTSQDGYAIDVIPGGGFRFRRYDSGVLANLFVSTTPVNTWYNLKITRDSAGLFSVYRDGALIVPTSGSNPITDSTYTAGQYMQFGSATGGDALGLTVLDTDQSLYNWTPLP
jgi:hypothetical protein